MLESFYVSFKEDAHGSPHHRWCRPHQRSARRSRRLCAWGWPPYIVVLSLAIVLFSVFPQIVTWLPEVLYSE
ncbi:hypothetical protein [Brevibacterium luteolum]|uniref:hypothetical protein n=1 Tax=Brevibacterium luteolum TaxID=199591 RepID=UPI00223AE6CB|nr:hypothetical protein [Brevibacterium luteolum]MCT1656877.1 hypothetical protein [Brevibacterium luteolum]